MSKYVYVDRWYVIHEAMRELNAQLAPVTLTRIAERTGFDRIDLGETLSSMSMTLGDVAYCGIVGGETTWKLKPNLQF